MTLLYSQNKSQLKLLDGWSLLKKYKNKFDKLGLTCPEQLVLHLPLRYEDETKLTAIVSLKSGKVQQVEGCVVKYEIVLHPRKQLVVYLRDVSGGVLILRLLNFYSHQLKMFTVGKRLRVLGEVRFGYRGQEMIHPKIRIVKTGEPLLKTLTPIYATTAGLRQSILRSIIDWALMQVDLDETIPENILIEHDCCCAFPSFSYAIRTIHHPPADIDRDSLYQKTHPAWQRVKLDELIAQQISLESMRFIRGKRRAFRMKPLGNEFSTSCKIISRLPFQLTNAQLRALSDISKDLSKDKPMNRLLQGDVGCGKSIVAALAAAQVLDAGFQVALMAPTELLVEQHGLKLHDWFSPFGVKVVILTSGQGKRQKSLIRSQIANGEANLVVGTQSVIQDDITFFKLGLVIIDEQHRFGVEQRLAFRQKAIMQIFLSPKEKSKDILKTSSKTFSSNYTDSFVEEASVDTHQLMMSATPIPRTLAMSYFSDLDVSTINELPEGRSEILTRLIHNKRRKEVIARVYAASLKGKQIYWVCPLIDESERLRLSTVLDVFENLSMLLPDVKIGLLHGKLPYLEKKVVMDRFAKGAIQLLVSTTVVEVGVDVPNASLMIIEHAERFGLAQLHQLRGRIGRGQDKSVCLLLYQFPLSPIARKRLNIIRYCTDGFAISIKDLELRGPGDFLGIRQSGETLLRFANFNEDAILVEAAKKIVKKLLNGSSFVINKHLARWFNWSENFWTV